ncbi:MAG: hypothetical protein WD595_04380 [Waddliaceae bacterium]
MSIDPINSPSSNEEIENGDMPPATQGSGTQDSLSSSTHLSIAERVSLAFAFDTERNVTSLIEFSKIMEDRFQEFKDTLLTAQREDPLVFKDLVLSSLQSATRLLQLLNATFEEVQEVNDNIVEINLDIEALNNAINTFQQNFISGLPGATPGNELAENNDINAIQAFQDAINTWNDPGTDQNDQTNIDAINSAIADYNIYFSSRNSQLNSLQNALNQALNTYLSQETVNNDLIDDINEIITSFGLDPLDPLTLPSSPISIQYPTYPGITNPTGNITLNPAPVFPQDLHGSLNTLPLYEEIESFQDFDSFVLEVTRHNQFMTTIAQMTDRQLEEIDSFLLIELLANSIVDPDAYISKEKSPGTSTGEPGANVGITTLGSNADAPSMEGSLTASIVELAQGENVERNNRIADLVNITQYFLLQNSALLSILPAGTLLGSIGRETDMNHEVVRAAAAIENSVRIGQLTESGAAIYGANRINEENGEIIQAGVNVSLAQIGTVNLAAALGVPGLGSEILELIANFMLSSAEDIFSGSGSLLANLGNPANQQELKANLTDLLLLQGGFTTEQAEAVSNATINAIQQNVNAGFQALRKAIFAAIDREELSAELAAKATEIVDALINAIVEQKQTEAAIHAETSRRELLDAIFSDQVNVKRETVQKAIEAAELRKGNFRSSLLKELVQRDVSLENALIASNRAAQFLATGSAAPLGVSIQNRLNLQKSLTGFAGPENKPQVLAAFDVAGSTASINGIQYLNRIKEALGPERLPALGQAIDDVNTQNFTSGLNDLQSNLKKQVFQNFRKDVGDEGAIDFASRASVALFGTPGSITHEEERNPVSLVNQLKDNMKTLYPTSGSQEPEDVRRANELKVQIQKPSESFQMFVSDTLDQYSASVVSIASAPYADLTPTLEKPS